MIDVNKLKELAQQATPGPWMWHADPVKGDPLNRSRWEVVATGCTITRTYYSDPSAEKDATFIAAANPAAVLELIETQRELVEALKALFKVASENLPLEECEEYEQTLAAIRHATGEYRE